MKLFIIRSKACYNISFAGMSACKLFTHTCAQFSLSIHQPAYVPLKLFLVMVCFGFHVDIALPTGSMILKVTFNKKLHNKWYQSSHHWYCQETISKQCMEGSQEFFSMLSFSCRLNLSHLQYNSISSQLRIFLFICINTQTPTHVHQAFLRRNS